MARNRSERLRLSGAGTVCLTSAIALAVVAACSAGSKNNGGTNPFGDGSGGTNGGGGGGVGALPGGGAGGDTGPNLKLDSGNYQPTGGTTGTGTGGVATLADGWVPVPTDQPVLVDECTNSPLDANTVAALQTGGAAGGMRLLYPYDGTVFPVGLLPPTFMWEGTGGTTGVYVHMKSSLFEYKGCFAGSANLVQDISAGAWATAGVQSGGAADPISVDVSTMSNGTVTTVHLTLIIARGKLKGDLFYNTYTSPQAANNGAVMRLQLGAPKPEVLLTDTGVAPLGPCWSCHSLGAQGTVLVAQHHQYPGGPYSSASFDLVANPNPQPPCGNAFTGNCQTMVVNQSASGEMGMGAVYPDGSKVLTMGSPSDSTINPLFPDGPGNIPAMIGPKASMLLDTKTGLPITMNGFTVQYAKMPSFSPDGTLVAFNWHEDSNGHSLAIANFDNTTNTFSNIRQIYKHDTLYPGWPFITPDNKEVVFVLGNAQDYVSAYPSRPTPASSDLWTVDIATGNARPLNRANGYPAAGGATYLPRPGRDEHLEYFPTLSPIAAAGYFWVFFTSRRTYGNKITQDAIDAPTKKIWVSAFNIRGNDLIPDPSNPPFYLPGQEAEAGNIRAFAALEPCHEEGSSCETGVDCCLGICTDGTCKPHPPPPPPPPPPDGGVIEPPPPPPCSNLDERCGTAADCCDPKAECIVHFCTIIEPPS